MTPVVGSFDALGFCFEIHARGSSLASELDSLFVDLATTAPAEHVYAIGPRTDVDAGLELTLDGHCVGAARTAPALVSLLTHDVNRRAIQASGSVTLHAGAVEVDGIGIVLPGAAEAGKSTLTAGLVRAGCAYLTDEAAAVDPTELKLRPYPKPLSIDPGAQPLFPELGEPSVGTSWAGAQWHVAANRIRPGAVGTACTPSIIVFPQYDPVGDTELEELGRAEALLELTHHTFDFNGAARTALDVLAAVVRRATCYRLRSSDLDRAVDLVSAAAA